MLMAKITAYFLPQLLMSSMLIIPGIGFFATNSHAASDSDLSFIRRNVGPHPYIPSDNLPVYDVEGSWPFGTWPNNVWWVPLERGVNQTDVVQAVVTPVKTPGDARGYKIDYGLLRQGMTNEEFKLASAVGRLVFKPDYGMQWSCTATHVGNGYVVTAGHCLADPTVTSDACSALQVEWDIRTSRQEFPKSQSANTLIGQCQEIVSWRFAVGDASTIDHAIFRVDKAPEMHVAIEPKPQLMPGSLVHQFSHPGGVPLIWADDCKITDALFQYYQHDCWGASGSSGAALIDANTHKLVGVLSMGLDSTHFSVRNDKSPIGCFDVNSGQVDKNCKQTK